MFLSAMPHREDEYKLFLFRLGSQRKARGKQKREDSLWVSSEENPVLQSKEETETQSRHRKVSLGWASPSRVS